MGRLHHGSREFLKPYTSRDPDAQNWQEDHSDAIVGGLLGRRTFRRLFHLSDLSDRRQIPGWYRQGLLIHRFAHLRGRNLVEKHSRGPQLHFLRILLLRNDRRHRRGPLRQLRHVQLHQPGVTHHFPDSDGTVTGVAVLLLHEE